jgi:hypothetical protein
MRMPYIALSILFGALSLGGTIYGSVLPPNNLDLEDSLFRRNANVTEAVFNQIIDDAIEKYTPIFAQHGATLVVERHWGESTVNAVAYREGDQWIVGAFGGLARRPEVTPDAFALAICHEIGHHLGGFATKKGTWAATEGQADYFATHSCAKIMWGDDQEGNARFRERLSSGGIKLCDSRFSTAEEKDLCYRTMAAGFSLATLLGTLQGTPSLAFESRDISVVSATREGHPGGQCRLDTYVAGSLCTVPFDPTFIPLTETESSTVMCTRASGFTREARPKCWFKSSL